MSWQELRESYQKRGLVLVLGAGVSRGSSVPTWPELLQRVIENEDLRSKLSVENLQAQGLSLPIVASMIEGHLKSREQFVECIRAALYEDIDELTNPGVDKDTYLRHLCEKNTTLRAVAALCVRQSSDGLTYSVNPKIRAVVNFNLDAILRYYVAARYGKPLLRTVERASASSTPGKISVYYMHGYLRFDKKAKRDRTKETPDAIVFTEQDYFDFFNKPTSVFNYTFLYLLREYPCCFIGLSMQDDNIRRLLHYTKLEQEEALRRESPDEDYDAKLEHKLRRRFVILSEPERAVQEDSLRRLGVTVLSVKKDFSDIPDKLGELYNSNDNGDNWSAVF